MVMFLIFLGKGFDQPPPHEGETPPEESVGMFFRLSLGGVVAGMVMFLGLYSWLMFITHEWVSQLFLASLTEYSGPKHILS